MNKKLIVTLCLTASIAQATLFSRLKPAVKKTTRHFKRNISSEAILSAAGIGLYLSSKPLFYYLVQDNLLNGKSKTPMDKIKNACSATYLILNPRTNALFCLTQYLCSQDKTTKQVNSAFKRFQEDYFGK